MPRSIFINIEPLRFIHLSNDRETISIVSFAWTSSLLIVSLSLSLFRFSNYEGEEEIHKRKYRAKVGNFQFIPLSPRDYFHRVKLVRFWKILLSPCQSNIPRALFKQRNPSVFNPCFYNFSIKFNYPRLFSPLFFKRRNSGGDWAPGSILPRIIRLSKTS